MGKISSPSPGATIHVRLEDVSYIDAPARLVAETVLPEARAGCQAPSQLAFTIDAPTLNPRARYVVRVHVDVDADGQISLGDYISTMSYRVEAGQETTTLLIPVKRVF